MDPAVIIPAFNRSGALKRLLGAIDRSFFFSKEVKIIISLDGGFSKDVLNIAEHFSNRFHKGKVDIIKRQKNLGVRDHILWCGNQTEKYGSVIVLEDDLYVNPNFYDFSINAANFFKDEEYVAGISLYSYRYNEFAKLPFEPLNNGFDNYFMQTTSSWGQIWTKKQWQKFKQWYNHPDNLNIREYIDLPEAVLNWKESSWKKYFNKYLVDNDLYFVYPYTSYTTNFSDKGGVHNFKGTNILQVPLNASIKRSNEYRFNTLNNSISVYDAFMEPTSDPFYCSLLEIGDEIEFDFYGIKPMELLKKKKYVITTKRVNKCLRSFDLSLKPFENVLLDEHSHNSNRAVNFTTPEAIVSNKRKYLDRADYFSYHDLFNKKLIFMLIIKSIVRKVNSLFAMLKMNRKKYK